jgi:ferredoxin-type protein NapG
MTDINRARMGLAVIDAENCLSWNGLRCEVCYRVCPVKGRAITIDPHPRKISRHAVFVPVIHSDACTGCGLCEKACPTQVAAVRIVPPSLVQGRIGEHFRMEWRPEAVPEAPAATSPAPGPRPAPPVPRPAAPAPGKAPGQDYFNAEVPS